MNSFFSVIIPLYNKEDYISDTIESVLKQTFTNFEVIIVNDGSTDKSISKLQNYNDSRLRVVDQENRGVSAARNKGITLAKAEYIAFLDADDLWLPEHLETLKALIKDYPECGMYCSRYKTKISKNKLIHNSFSNAISDNYRGIIPDFFEASLINRIPTASSVAISKKILSKIGCFDTKLINGEDWDLWIRIALYYPIAITNKVTAIYRFDVIDSLSKKSITEKKTINFNKFTAEEKKNKRLKSFLDHYRIEYALQYRVINEKRKSKELISKINSTPSLKLRILLKSPPLLLKMLLKLKHILKTKGINFSIYN